MAVAPEVRRVSVKDGDFSFLDQTGNWLRVLQEWIFAPTFATLWHSGEMQKSLEFRCGTVFSWISSVHRFATSPMSSNSPKISARVAKGEVNGYFAMQPEAEDSPFTTSINFHDVLADQIVENAGGPREWSRASWKEASKPQGKLGDPEALVGEGEIFLRDGRVQQYRLLVLLGQISCRSRNYRSFIWSRRRQNITCARGMVTIDELVLRSPNIRLTSSGTVAFDGTLQLNSQLAINDRVRGQLFKAIRDNFIRIDEPGYSAIEFQVGGTVDRPSTNLVEQVVGRDISSMLNSFFGGKKDRPEEKEGR